MKALKQLTRSVLACLLCIGLLYSIPTIAYAAVDWPQVTDFSIIETKVPIKDGTEATQQATANIVHTKDITSTNNIKTDAARTIARYVIKQYDALETADDGSFIAGEIRLYAKEKVTDKSVYIWQNNWRATVTKGTAGCIQGTTASGNPSTRSIRLQLANNYINSNTFYVEDNGVKYYYKVMLVNPFEITQFDAPYRISETAAEIKINTKEAVSCYYAVVDSGAAAPEIDTSGTGIPLRVGDNSVPVTLTAGAKDVYVAAKNEDGSIATLKIAIGEALSTSTLTLYLSGASDATFIKAEVKGAAATAETSSSNVTVISDLHYNDSVKIWLQPKDPTKCISEASLVSAASTNAAQALYYSPTVNSEENSITFAMPAVASLRNAVNFNGTTENGWLHYVDAAVASHNLTGKVSKLWEHQPEGLSNSKGILTFTDESGAAITVAKEGSKVIATAEPRDAGSWYEFKFVEWADEQGVTITGADRTNPRLEFEMGTEDVYLFAKFENVGTNVEWGTNISEVNNVVSVHCNGNGTVNPFVYKTGAGARFTLVATTTAGWQDGYAFDDWTILRDGNEVPKDEITYEVYGKPGEVGYYTVPTVTVGGSNMKVTANFHARLFAAVTAKADPATMGSAAVSVSSGEPKASIPVVFEGQTVTLTATPKSQRYKLDETNPWTVKENETGTVIPVTVSTADPNVATFTMPSTGKDITATANFVVDTSKPNDDCSLLRVELWSADGKNRLASSNKSGDTYTLELPADKDVSDLPKLRLKFICGDAEHAVVKRGDTEWSKDGQACEVTSLGQTQVFTVTAEDKKTSAPYKVVINAETKITAVTLLDGTKTIATGTLTGAKWTITLRDSIDADLLTKIGASDKIFMKIEYVGKSLKQVTTTNGAGYDDAGQEKSWASGKVVCAVSPGSEAQFIVTGIDGLTKEYTIAITRPNVSTTPVLTKVSVERTSDTAATVKFNSTMAGNYFYKVVDKGVTVNEVDTTKGGMTAVKGENTITLTNLAAGARDIYIVVKSASNVECDPFKIEIPAYGSTETPDEGDFTIKVNAPPTGGTITTNRTRANEGDEIIVTVTPKAGYQMKAGSLRYAFSTPGAAYTAITGYSFKMPGGNIDITCDWETASTTVDGITAFSINGIAAAVNNTTNTITITMPRGTDVTKLTPVIATNGVKSLTPGSGVTMDFTNAVTYTATMDDGSTKTYIVTVYVNKGTLADQFWDKLTDFVSQVPWWEYAKHQQSTSSYPKYW